MQLATNEVIYVGDSDVDILTAKNANIQMITVTWGFRDLETLKNIMRQILSIIQMRY